MDNTIKITHQNMQTAAMLNVGALKPSGSGDAKNTGIKDTVNLDSSSQNPSVPQKELTLLFYLDSQDAMANEFSLKPLEDLAKVKSDENINIVVQAGLSPPEKDMDLDIEDQGLLGKVTMPEWTGVKRFEITSDGQAKQLEFLPDGTIMKNLNNLENFIAWGMEKYNAKHYATVVLKHGHAWKGFTDDKAEAMSNAIKNGVDRANKATGDDDKMDMLYLQSCKMGSTEALSEIGKAADVVVGSEYTIFAFSNRDMGNLIDGLKQDVKTDGKFDPKKFAGNTVEYFKELNKDNSERIEEFRRKEDFAEVLKYSQGSLKRTRLVKKMLEEGDEAKKAEVYDFLNVDYAHGYQTLSAVDATGFPRLTSSLKDFVDACKKYKIPNKVLFKAIEEAKNFDHQNNPRHYSAQLHDLGGIMDNLAKSEGIHPAIKEAVEKVREAYGETVINEQHDPARFQGSEGLTIWAPTNALQVLMEVDEYKERADGFISKTGWSDLIMQGIDNMPPDAAKKLDGVRGLIGETVALLNKFNDPSLPKDELQIIAKQIVENKKVIYALEPEMKLKDF